MSIPSSGRAMPSPIPTRSPIGFAVISEESRLNAVVTADVVPYTPAGSEEITMLCFPIRPQAYELVSLGCCDKPQT